MRLSELKIKYKMKMGIILIIFDFISKIFFDYYIFY